jgi:hypothetical protein
MATGAGVNLLMRLSPYYLWLLVSVSILDAPILWILVLLYWFLVGSLGPAHHNELSHFLSFPSPQLSTFWTWILEQPRHHYHLLRLFFSAPPPIPYDNLSR